MSRTKGHDSNAKIGLRFKEYWKSRLRRWGDDPGRWTKKMTAKKERRRDKKIIKDGNDE